MHYLGYSFPMQAKIVMCSFSIHIFVRKNQGDQEEYDVAEEEDETFDPCSVDIDDNDNNAFTACRNGIAFRMKRAVVIRG